MMLKSSSPVMGKVRIDVVKKLATTALAAMDEAGIEHLTVAEVASAAFTLCQNIVIAILEGVEPHERQKNVDEITTAIASLYELVRPDKVN